MIRFEKLQLIKICFPNIRSVVEIGKIQKIKYKEIFIDFYSKEIKEDEVGCVLVAMPYFHLASKAFCEGIDNLSLEEWRKFIGRRYEGAANDSKK